MTIEASMAWLVIQCDPCGKATKVKARTIECVEGIEDHSILRCPITIITHSNMHVRWSVLYRLLE